MSTPSMASTNDSQCSISEKEPFQPDDMIHRHQSHDMKRIIIIFLASQTAILAIFGTILTITLRSTILTSSSAIHDPSPNNVREFGGLPVQYDDPKAPYVTCRSADTPTAAFKAGCRFDLFANGWTPSPCFDAEKHDYFVGLHDYRFWKDEHKQHRIHQEDLLTGTLGHLELYVSFEEHWEHCRYLLNCTKRYARDPSLGVLDIHLDEEHMNHCIDFVAETRDPYTLEDDIVAIFDYRKCYLPRSV